MKNQKFIRILALLGVLLLISLYIITLILAFMKSSEAQLLFRGSIIATIGIPVTLYMFMLIYKYLKGRNDN